MATDIKRVEKPHVLTGNGAPADADQLTDNTAAYPVNSIYFDKDSGIGYVRADATKTAATDWVSGSGGSGAATILQSPDSTLWQLQINDSGVLVTAQVTSGTAGTLHLFSPNNTEWNVTVNNSGALITTAI